MKVLLSIKPEFAEKIFQGEKCFEYRKAIFKEKIETIVLYASMPVCKIVGELQIDQIISDTPASLWEQTKQQSGISHEFFHQYFQGKTKGYAIKIAAVEKYETPIDPYLGEKKFIPPQSFRYI